MVLNRSVAFIASGLAIFGLGQGAVVVSSYSKLIEEARYTNLVFGLLIQYWSLGFSNFKLKIK